MPSRWGSCMRKLVLSLVLLVLWTWCSRGQDMGGGIIYSKFRQFRIPFDAGLATSKLKQLQLFVSQDQGKSWQPSAIAPPDQRHFRFIADRDGYFWFTVQTQDLDGKLYPPSLGSAQPSLKVIIDTAPPRITLQPAPPRQGEVGVSWNIQDDNPDLALGDALRLEFRHAGSATWFNLPINPQANQFFWNPNTSSPVEVRMRVRDRAGNWGEALTTVSLGGGAAPVPQPGFEQPSGLAQPPLAANRKLVNTKRITLNYELKEVGPSGVALIDLWFTQDGRSWHKYPPRPGEDPNQKAISFDVAGEGMYGLTLVAKSGVGLSERPPQIGDPPQIWIEVDLTKPVVQLHSVAVGQGPEKGKVTFTWSAYDKNLGKDPIALSYAEQVTGPWTPIAQGLANTGRYVWTMPERVPFQFLVKVEAADLAGNLGEAISEGAIKVDLSQPKVNITNVVPGGK